MKPVNLVLLTVQSKLPPVQAGISPAHDEAHLGTDFVGRRRSS